MFRGDRILQITKWVEKLKADGMEGVTAQTGVFGLTKKQILEVHQALTGKVNFSTRGLTTAEAVARIARGLQLEVTLDPTARAAMASPEKVADELQGLALGPRWPLSCGRWA